VIRARENLPGEHHEDDPPPVLSTWPRVYIFVLVYLACLIGAFYAFTVHFAPPATPVAINKDNQSHK
jgi:hypothetical protein